MASYWRWHHKRDSVVVVIPKSKRNQTKVTPQTKQKLLCLKTTLWWIPRLSHSASVMRLNFHGLRMIINYLCREKGFADWADQQRGPSMHSNGSTQVTLTTVAKTTCCHQHRFVNHNSKPSLNPTKGQSGWCLSRPPLRNESPSRRIILWGWNNETHLKPPARKCSVIRQATCERIKNFIQGAQDHEWLTKNSTLHTVGKDS